MTKKWRTISLRQELITAAERTLKTSHYNSLTEFVSEAIRIRLEELKQSHEKIYERPVDYPIIHERLLYSPNHIWVMVTPEGNIRVGLSNYTQRHLEAVVDIKTDPVRSKVTKGKPFGVIETWMFSFDLFSPISGKIVQINKVLQDDPLRIINKDSYETRWIAEIKPSNLIVLEEELRELMSPRRYKIFLNHT